MHVVEEFFWFCLFIAGLTIWAEIENIKALKVIEVEEDE